MKDEDDDLGPLGKVPSQRLDEVREALRRGDLTRVGRLALLFRLMPVAG